LNENELGMVYICHYIFAAFAKDKEAFFKWHLTHDSGQVKDSEDFRKTTFVIQAGIVAIIEDSGIWNDNMEKRKQKLVAELGILR